MKGRGEYPFKGVMWRRLGAPSAIRKIYAIAHKHHALNPAFQGQASFARGWKVLSYLFVCTSVSYYCTLLYETL